MTVAVLMTCYNRKELTLRCLKSLRDNEKPETGNEKLSIDVYLNDDGSTDGTGEAVREWFDSAVSHGSSLALHLVRGSGSDYWAKGMARAWRVAGDRFDAYLWLNDDVVLCPDALDGLLEDFSRSAADAPVLVGSCVDGEGRCIYGAVDARGEVIDPRKVGEGEAPHWFNGNVVLVPNPVSRRVGIISDEYSHGRADFDYAERLRRAGIPFRASSRIVGTCEYNCDPNMRGTTRMGRLRRLFKPGYWNLHDLWLFRSRYYGKFRALVSCAHHVVNAAR